MTELAKRLLLIAVSLMSVATISFFLLHAVPGDPVDLMLGDQASSADRQALRASLGLDQPLLEQYLSFIRRLSVGDLGKSLIGKKTVRDLIAERLPASLELALAAMILALFFGITLGVVASVNKQSLLDRSLSFLSLAAASAPSFWLGPILVAIFALQLDLFPISERGGLEHLFLPSLTLALGLGSVIFQITRNSMLEVIGEDYIRTARAKGANTFNIFYRHALRNALMPVVSVAGLQFGVILTGAILVETIFDWPGLGTLLYQAIQQRNYPVVQGCVLTIATLYVVVNSLTDITYTLINPRVRIQ